MKSSMHDARVSVVLAEIDHTQERTNPYEVDHSYETDTDRLLQTRTRPTRENKLLMGTIGFFVSILVFLSLVYIVKKLTF
jgi:hypothetical protein